MHEALPVAGLYFPVAQASHGPPFGPVNPRLQRQVELPTAELELSGQFLQVVLAFAPTVVEYWLTEQFVHAVIEVAPIFAEYVPAPQAVHVATKDAPVAVEYLPAPQSIQVDCAKAPTVSEYLPAAQSVHAALPTVGLYLPAAHEAHDCASGPVKPAAQPSCTQSARASLPAGELLPAGQVVQADIETAPVASEYVSAPQSRHAALPALALYLPAMQAVQVPPSGPE